MLPMMLCLKYAGEPVLPAKLSFGKFSMQVTVLRPSGDYSCRCLRNTKVHVLTSQHSEGGTRCTLAHVSSPLQGDGNGV
jgi:hypothetical protein